MKKFSLIAYCKKCGLTSQGFKAEYKADDTCHEVIERTCSRCGFKWNELPLDYKEDEMNNKNLYVEDSDSIKTDSVTLSRGGLALKFKQQFIEFLNKFPSSQIYSIRQDSENIIIQHSVIE